MKSNWSVDHSLSFLLCFSLFTINPLKLLAQSASADSSSSQNLKLSGPPDIANGPLNPDSFVPFKVQKVKGAKLVFFNEDYFIENGIKLPFPVYKDLSNSEYSDDLVKWAVDNWAFVVPASDIDPKHLDRETKTFYADRYGGGGGDGVNGDPDALGSGRAASEGFVNIKGIGRTPLASSDDPNVVASRGPKSGLYGKIKHYLSAHHHLHGGASERESILEAVWGEILTRELPYGGNRVIAIISLPMTIGLFKEPRALIIRENSIRPAHFMRTSGMMRKDQQWEENRSQKLALNFAEYIISISNKNGNLTSQAVTAKNLNVALLDMITRMTETFASEYAKSIFHGASSPSNIEISGKALDHGPLTYLDGFTKGIYADKAGNGEIFGLTNELIAEILEDLRVTLPSDLKSGIPSDSQMQVAVDSAYKKQFKRELLIRAGFPKEIVENTILTSQADSFFKIAQYIAQKGNADYRNLKGKIPRDTGKYNFGETMLAAHSSKNTPVDLDEALTEHISDAQTRSAFVKAYIMYSQLIKERGLIFGISSESMREYLVQSAKMKNKVHSELFRGPKLWLAQYAAILKARILKKPLLVKQMIDRLAHENVTQIDFLPEFSTLTSVKKIKGNWVYTYFNAVSSQYESRISLGSTSDESVGLFYKKFAVDQLSKQDFSVLSSDLKPMSFKLIEVQGRQIIELVHGETERVPSTVQMIPSTEKASVVGMCRKATN